MSWEISVILFVLGLAFGSFLNVVSLRYHPEGGRLFGAHIAKGRSKCRSCQKTLSWYELIPIVSFVIQGKRCRSCKAPLSWQYPIVELVSGGLFVGVPMLLRSLFPFFVSSWGWWAFVLMSGLWIAVFLLLVIVFLIDLRWYVIPNLVNGMLFVLGLIWVVLGSIWHLFDGISQGSFLGSYAPVFFGIENPIFSHALGLLVGGGFFMLIVLLSRGRAMGMGDVKLMAPLGLLFGWPDVLVIIFLSFVIGALISLVLMIRKKRGMADRVPFGPFIVLASAIVFFWGAGLLAAYFGIIGM